MILEFEFCVYLSDAAAQQAVITALDSFKHGGHIVIPKTPSGPC